MKLELFSQTCASNPETICPSCGSRVNEVNYRISHESGESYIYRCPTCRLRYVHPLLLAERNDRQMESVDDAELFNNPVLRTLHKRLIIDREIDIVSKILGRQGYSLLDIGCGTGWIAKIWRDRGIDVTGLEPSPNRARIAREQRGIRVLECFVEDLGSEERFDVVTIRHVLEHLEYPLETLQRIRSHLSEDGLLVVIVPNIDCLGRFLFGTNWSWILPWHCLFFNPHSLTKLVERAGFKVEKLYQTPSPLWYPESFFRAFPVGSGLVRRLYERLSIFTLLPVAPLVATGYLTGYSDNITLICRVTRG